MKSFKPAQVLTVASVCAALGSPALAARPVQADQNGVHQVAEEALVYRAKKSAVVTVESDFGHGSGFVVDGSGLVITNQHVTNGSQWVALRFGPGTRIPAALVTEDKEADVAVIRFNPAAVKVDTVIPLADPTGVLAVEGERVLAIGNPLWEDTILTTGIISKVNKDVLVSNININPGSSGGPLLNLSGQAIGLTTFTEQSNHGPGVAGIVSIAKAVPVLEQARAKLAGIEMPPATLLPDVSDVPIPAAALDAASEKSIKPVNLRVTGYTASIYTPFTITSEQHEFDREVAKNPHRDQKSEPIRFYDLNLPQNRATVTVMFIPGIRETNGSRNRSLLAGFVTILSGGLIPASIRGHSFEYSSNFSEMQLYRGDKLIEPVRRGKISVSANMEALGAKIKDKAYGGSYQYDPSAFEPGVPVKILVKRQPTDANWETINLDAKQLQGIWDQFEPWRSACASLPKDKAAGSPAP